MYRLMKSPYVQERIQAHLEAANLNTDEIIGTLVNQMRGDLAYLFPDCKILKDAQQKGISNLIKRVRMRQKFIPQRNGKKKRLVWYDIDIYSAQEATKALSRIFDLRNLVASRRTKAHFAETAAIEATCEVSEEVERPESWRAALPVNEGTQVQPQINEVLQAKEPERDPVKREEPAEAISQNSGWREFYDKRAAEQTEAYYKHQLNITPFTRSAFRRSDVNEIRPRYRTSRHF